jgi:hypothetical protein
MNAENDNLIADAFISNIMEQKKRKRGFQEIEENDDGRINRKKRRVNNSDSCQFSDTEDNGDWEYVKSPFLDAPTRENFCFACEHIGENMPAIKGLPIQDLIISMGSDLSTTDPMKHYQNISDKYEKTIRKPINDLILKGNNTLTTDQTSKQVLLPEWTPEMVKEHIETHHNDPELSIQIFMKNLKKGSKFIWDNSLFQRKKHKNQHINRSIQENENINQQQDQNENQVVNVISDIQNFNCSQYRADPSQWKIYREMMELYLKLGKSNPTKMTPFHKEGRFNVANKSQHGFFNLENKNIYNPPQKLTQTDFNISY